MFSFRKNAKPTAKPTNKKSRSGVRFDAQLWLLSFFLFVCRKSGENQVFRIKSCPQRGQVIAMVPFPFGTRHF